MTCQWNLNSGFQSLAGFRISNAEFRIPKPQTKSRFRIPDYIKVRYNEQKKRAAGFVLLQNELNRVFSLTCPASMQSYWNKRNRSQALITSPPSLVKGSGKQFTTPTRGGCVRVMISIAGKSDQYHEGI